jgi:aryl sulfotransferase
MDIFWLASYPKSGNTWIRFLFTHLLQGPFETSQTIFEVTPVLERGVDASLLRSDRPNFIKTHYLFHDGLPWLDRTKGAVYVVRNPFDVLMSNLNYMFLNNQALAAKSGDELQRIADGYVQSYLQEGGDPRWKKVKYGSWREHVESWTENDRGIPVTLVRFEDLLADPRAALTNLCARIGLDATQARIDEAVTLSDFVHMRAMEEREIAARQPGMF